MSHLVGAAMKFVSSKGEGGRFASFLGADTRLLSRVGSVVRSVCLSSVIIHVITPRDVGAALKVGGGAHLAPAEGR